MAGRNVVAHAIDEAGNPTALQEQQVADAQSAGFKPISATEAALRAQADADANYVDQNYGTLGKAALGAVDGATLGLAPALGVSAGLLDAGHLDAARQSGAYTAGDIAGTLLPAFLSGGTSLEARGAGGVVSKALGATPAGMLGRVGGLAENAVARFLPEAGLMGKAASGSIRMAARGATEAALMNVAHTASDDIIQNKPLSAQALLASAEDGALFGGLTGGILGGAASLAGSGVELAGSRALGGAGAGGERSAGVALKRLGLEGKLGEIADREGRFTGALREYSDLMQKAETSFAAPTSHIRESLQKLVKEQETVAQAALRDLGQIAKPGDEPLRQLFKRFDTEFGVMYKGTADQTQAMQIYRGLKKDLVKATEWEQWAKNRDILTDRAASATGVKKTIYESALNAFDDEFRLAGTKVDEGLFAQYAAAKTSQRVGAELIEGTGNKLAQEAGRGNPLHLNGADAATGAYGLIAGHPVGAAGIVLGKKITGYIQEKLEPAIAEYAARSALGSAAGAATANVGNRLSGALKSFMSGARISTEKAYVEGERKAPKLSYTMKAYQQQMDLADALTSVAHQQKVREHTEALAMAGHEELAQAMQDTYGRAVAYVQQNKPKGRSKEQAAGSLGKTPKSLSPDTAGWKFLRQIHSMRDPVGTIVEGLEKGNLSRDAIATIKYVMPDLHQELVTRAAQEVMSMKQEGKFLPADKLALLGVALDYPVDSKLQGDFIKEIQQGHAANKKPTPAQQDAPPPVTDISQYQTPLQSSV